MAGNNIKVLDCTIRDGGLMNNHKFDLKFVRAVYKALSEANIDYMEIGYKNSRKLFSASEFGSWKFCADEDILKVIKGVRSKTKIAVMVDVDRVEPAEVKPKKESPVSMIRVATYIKDIEKAVLLCNQMADKGYETAVNIMAVSKAPAEELSKILSLLDNKSKADVIFISDSNGSLYHETVAALFKKAKKYIISKETGIHAHNNLQLAFSNTIEAIQQGASYLDCSIYGLGRAAGNCPTELLLGFLKNPKYDIRPVLDVIAKEFIPLRKKLEWGYIIPYAIAGILDEHPKAAMALRDSAQKDNFREFYESLTTTKKKKV